MFAFIRRITIKLRVWHLNGTTFLQKIWFSWLWSFTQINIFLWDSFTKWIPNSDNNILQHTHNHHQHSWTKNFNKTHICTGILSFLIQHFSNKTKYSDGVVPIKSRLLLVISNWMCVFTFITVLFLSFSHFFSVHSHSIVLCLHSCTSFPRWKYCEREGVVVNDKNDGEDHANMHDGVEHNKTSTNKTK